jgi:hypothetical protein
MRRWAPALLVLLTLTACDFSHVKPGQTVVISGRALSATGAPLKNATVTLYKEADFGEFIVGSALALGSLGGVCLFPGAPAICHKGRTTTTNDNGAYQFTVKGSDTQGLIGDASTLDVVFTAPGNKSGPSTTLRFKARTSHVRLPTAALQDLRLHVGEGTRAHPVFRFAWHARTTDSYTAQLLNASNGLSMWSQPAGSGSATVDARILEDRAAAAAVTAHHDLGNGVSANYLSARVSVKPIAGAPSSRHAPCAAVTGTDHLDTFRQTVCVATDGDLSAPSRLTATNGKVVTGVQLDLQHAKHVSLVVARGMGGSVVIEVSKNGRNWRQVATAAGETIAVKPAGRPVVRYVRVRSASGLDESLVAEVSVWS